MPLTELKPEFYTLLVKNSSDLISTIDIAGTYTYVSDSVTSILGYDPEELLGRTPFEFIHQEDADEAQETLQNITQYRQLVLSPFRFRHKNGSWRWVETTVTNMLEDTIVKALVTNSKDITEKVLLDIKQKKSKAYYSALFFNHPDLVFTLNQEGLVDNANDGVFALTGYRKEDVWNSNFASFIKPASLEATQRAFGKAMRGEALTFETTILNASGHELDLCVTLVPVVLYGEVKGVQCIARNITELKQANQRLTDHAEQLTNILESITEPFIALDRQWRYSYANRKAADFIGCQQEALIGEVIWEKFDCVIGSNFHTKCLQVAETGVSAEFDEYFNIFDATLSFRIYRFDKGIAVQFSDTSAIKAAQAELKKLSLVASKTNNAFFITNNRHEIEWANDAFVSQTGYTLEEAMGNRPFDLLNGPSRDLQTLQQTIKRIEAGESFSLEMLRYKKNGEQLWVTVDVSPIHNQDGNLDKVIVLQTDITERKLSQLKLEQLTKDLSKQNRDLQQFTYIVSHNLRAPVANVTGLTKLLQSAKPEAPHFKEALANLDKSAFRLDAVIKDLNQILSLKAGVEESLKEQISLKEILEEVICSLQPAIEKEQAQVTLEVRQQDVLAANRAYIYSIFHNLLSNALKYRSLHRAPHIQVQSIQEHEALTVMVSDNGMGMDMAKVRQHVFTLYSRFHTNIKGKGFGLYLVKSQVEALGGTIEVESKVEKGTQFTLKFRKGAHVC